jgi:hypothetical protein
MNRTFLQTLETRAVEREFAPIAQQIRDAKLERTVAFASLIAGAIARAARGAAVLGEMTRASRVTPVSSAEN